MQTALTFDSFFCDFTRYFQQYIEKYLAMQFEIFKTLEFSIIINSPLFI